MKKLQVIHAKKSVLISLKVFVFISLSILVTACSNSPVDCDRDCIATKVDEYVAAMVAQAPEKVSLAKEARSTQNGKDTQPGDGVWQTITAKGSFQQTFIDDGLESAVFFGAFTEKLSDAEQPLLLAIRFAFENGEITEVEHLLSRPDARNRLINMHKLTEPNAVYEEILPEDQRSSRDELIAAAHAYFDGIANSTDEGVPMHRECVRRENGVTLLKNDAPETQECPIGFHRFNYITDIRDRRVAIIDEARGLVLAFAIFDIPGNIDVASGPWGPSDLAPQNGERRVDSRKVPRSLYIAELFRLVDGKIRDIDAIMFNEDLGFKAGW